MDAPKRALETLTLPSQYMLSVMTFLVDNLEFLTFSCTVSMQEINYNYTDQ